MAASITFHELGASDPDLSILRSFYTGLYTAEFPDPDERESYDNMVMYLRAAGSHPNGYHIVLAVQSGEVVGASITDYFAISQTGVIEFIVVAEDRRGSGVGQAILQDAEARLTADAARAGGRLAFIAAEINDPFQRSQTPDNVDPFERVRWWDRRGFGKLDFPYVQPPLSAGQRPVHNLLLGAKPCAPPDARSVSATSVVAFVRDYLVYAMRIAEPEDSAEFVAMSRWLAARDAIGIVSLRAYVGDDAAHPIEVQEVADSRDECLDGALRVYTETFADSATMVPPGEFRSLVDHPSRLAPSRYHFWSLSVPGAHSVSGMASFFSLPSAGFGGYIALVAPLRGSGALPAVIARIEQQLVRDSFNTVGWYIECAEEKTATLFVGQGFYEIAVAFRQPPLGTGPLADDGRVPLLRLLYKEFGARYGPPVLSPTDFTSALHDIFLFVYDIAQPPEHPFYMALAAQAEAWNSVPFVADGRARRLGGGEPD